MNILAMLWGRTATMLVGAASVLMALFGIRYSIRKRAKEEMSNEIRERTIERIEVAHSMERDVDAMSNSDVADELRDHGWIRD